ncbi:hypothetical protein K2173_003128 [Erythroxylum novogranatense]|uniref:PGG domain-containing protein n=1 Tax=Erythroxylum novogranatense TaxID=1862640 RepID=A0AAV8TA69_9ROSI|nr:hypothetical protein K2173_003128 [Erythroxylum novogranatense]
MDARLYKAAKSGNVCFLRQLLNENRSLLAKLTPNENTALHIAVLYGHQDVAAEIYCRSRSLLTRPNIHGDTPLHVAGRCGHLSIVKFLVNEILCESWQNIENGIVFNFELLRQGNEEKNTVLHEAVRNGHLDVTKFLLEVDPMLACYHNHGGESPLFVAARDGLRDIVNQILIATPSSAHGGSNGQTALHAAIMWKHSGIVEDLLKAKPELVTESDHEGRTPLYHAAELGDLETVQRLLELDTSAVYMLDKKGHAPLHIASRKGHINILKQFIRCCPDSGELLDLSGRNALHFAVLSGRTNVVRYMIEAKELEGLINQADTEGNTPLHLAAIERKTWIVWYLIRNDRVDRTAKNKSGNTAVEIDESIEEYCRTFSRNMVARFLRALISPPSWKINDKNTTLPDQHKASLQNYRQMGQSLLMVSTLITTLTFVAAFTLPGGFNNDIGPGQGLALLQNTRSMKWFVVTDTVAMISSLTAACLISWGAMSSDAYYIYYFATANLLTFIALQFTWMAFMVGILAVMPGQRYVHVIANILGLFFHFSSSLFLIKLLQILPISEALHLVTFDM